MAIGQGWAEGAWVDAGWVTGAWEQAVVANIWVLSSGDVTQMVRDGPRINVGWFDYANTRSPASTLSNAARLLSYTATYTSSRSTQSISGKSYFEFRVNASTSRKNNAGGILLSTDDLASWTGQMGFTSDSYGLDGECDTSSNSLLDNDYTDVLTPFTDWLRVAMDNDTGKVWVGNATLDNWFGSGDPAAGTNPEWTLATGVTYYAGFSVGNPAQSIDINLGSVDFIGTVPAGFSGLGDN